MTCEEVRDALSFGEADPEALRHLEGCPGCARWDAALQSIRAEAPSLAGDAPSNLTAGVLAAVRRAGAGPLPDVPVMAFPPVPPPTRPRPPAGRPVRWPVAAAAGVVALAAVGVLALRPGAVDGREPREAVAAAAGAFAEPAGSTFRFAVEGEVRVRVDVPPLPTPLPAFPFGAPADPEALCAGIPEAQRAPCREQAEAFRAEIEKFRSRFGAAPGFPTPGAPFEVSMAFEGEGAADVAAESARLSLRHRTAAPVRDSGSLDLVTVRGRTYVRTPETGGWVVLPESEPGLGFGDLAVLPRMDEALRALRNPPREVQALDESTLDGARVRGYRFAAGGATVTLWVGAGDDRLRKLEVAHDRPGSARVRLAVRFFGFGAPVTVEEPAEAVPLDRLPPERRPRFGFGASIR